MQMQTQPENYEPVAYHVKMIEAQSWFKQHEATLITPSVLQWKAPNSSICWMKFIVDHRFLIVLGDLGEAVYEWSQNVTLPWLASLGFSYFAGKCTASEHGRRFEEWSEMQARARLHQMKEDNADVFRDVLAPAAIFNREEWNLFVWDESNRRADLDPADFWDIGMQPSLRCVAHWLGLRRAVQSIAPQYEVVAGELA